MVSYNIDSFALRRILGLNDPHVVLLFGPQIVKVGVEVCEFVWEDISVGDYIERLLAKLFLHLDNIGAKTVLSSQLAAHREVVYFLVFV